uniref:Peptidase M16 C-terminal domain-containing protein n=1 Tax=Romanomermis culicivorax TaxID=13658 RepID=A0A915J574_ROMCU
TKRTDNDLTSSDECSIRDDSTTFDFYQNATSGKDKLYNLVQQLKNMKFETQLIDKEVNNVDEGHPDYITLPTAHDRFRYNSYANAFRGRKAVGKAFNKITNKKLILKEMINFYDKHYSADRILVVLSQTNIYENGEKYMELLSTIPKRKSITTTPYKVGYEIRAPNEKILQLYFPLKNANLANEASCNYLQYYFFNTKISNGFEWMLTESGLVNDVSTSCFPTSWSHKDVVFQIAIELTENGLKNTKKVLELIFSYLNRIKSKNIEKWVHEEVIKDMDPYAAKIKYNLIQWLSEVTKRASKYGLKNSLVGAPKIFDVNMIRSMLNNLNAYNFNCLRGVPAKGADNGIQLVEIQRAMLEKLQAIHLKEADAVEMPLKNLNLEGLPCTQMPEEFELPEEYAGPAKKLIIDQPGKKLWFLPTQPDKNATYILLAFMVRLPREIFLDAKAHTNLMLMIESMNMLVNQELLTKMSNGGCYNLLIQYHHTGIKVLIYAEPGKVNFIIDNIFHVLTHKRVTKGVLNKARKHFLIPYDYDDSPHATYENLFHTVRSMDGKMLEALEGATTDSIESILKALSRQIEMEALLVANVDEKVALENIVARRSNHQVYMDDTSDMIKQLQSPSSKIISDYSMNFPNAQDLIKTYRTLFNAQSEQHRKLAIYFYAKENGERLEATAAKNVKLIKDIEEFRSEHQFVTYEHI